MRYASMFLTLLCVILGGAGIGLADEKPRQGGELIVVVGAEPPSLDAHREETFGLMHVASAHYNTLLRIDPTDRTGTKPVPDLAKSWTVSGDGRAYTFQLRRGVKFHDGSELTSRDVKASYDKIVFPPAGVVSIRQGMYTAIEAIEAPDPWTVVFRLKVPSASFLASVASPYNWIYKADILAKDPRWYEKNIMGTGPFTFVEYVRGSHWVGKKNPDYWDRGKPYLDGYRAIFVRDSGAQVAAIRSERAMIQLRTFTPAERDTLVRVLGDKVTVQESPWNAGIVLAINHEVKPFDDRRVRRALALALNRYEGAQALSQISGLNVVSGVQLPGTAFATPPAELERVAGYGRDIAKSRAEAKRLLREAGVPEGFSFVYKNRGVPVPYEPLAVWLLDQWRQVGLNVRQEVQETGVHFSDLRAGKFEVAADFHAQYMVEPDIDLHKYRSKGISAINNARYTDPLLDELFVKQSQATNHEERKRYVREFERRLLDDEAHYIFTLMTRRIVVHLAKVRGWTITPSHLLNCQLDTVWLAE